MKNRSTYCILFFLTFPGICYAQLLDRVKGKMNSKSAITTQHSSEDEARGNNRENQSTDITMVVAKKIYATYDQASSNSINEVSDGDSLWLYIKSTKPFKELVDIRRIPQDDGNVLKSQILSVRLGPNDNSAPFSDLGTLCFGKGKECKYDDRIDPAALEASEIRLALTKFDPKGSSRALLSTIGEGRPGNWDNQIRLYVLGQDKPAAVVRLNCKLEDGIAKYKKMWAAYGEAQLKGDETTNELPEPAEYQDANLRETIVQKAKQKGIIPARFFFTNADWVEVEESSISRFRYMTAAVTYKKGGKCLYGTVYIRQDYAFGRGAYGPSTISFSAQDLPLACEKI